MRQKKVAKEDKRKMTRSKESELEKKDIINKMVTVGDPNSLNDVHNQEKIDTVAVDPSFLSDRDSVTLLETSLTMIILR